MSAGMGTLRCAALVLTALAARGPAPEGGASAPQDADPARALVEAFAREDIHLDLAGRLCSVPAEVLVRGDLLEYLIANPRGAVHESAFLTHVPASRLNAALLALGAQAGENARWKRREPAPTLEEMRAGAPAFDVTPPTGDGFYLYAAWKVDGVERFYRMEDLILDLRAGQTMRYHRWVYLGSRMLRLRGEDEREAFAADLEGNLVNIAFFEQGNTLLTGALPECLDQTVWQSNYWLLPARGSAIELIFAREPLAQLPAAIAARLREAQRVEPGDER